MNRPSRDHVGTVSVARMVGHVPGKPAVGGDDEDVGLPLGWTGVESDPLPVGREPRAAADGRAHRRQALDVLARQHPPHRSPAPPCGGKRRRPCCHRAICSDWRRVWSTRRTPQACPRLRPPRGVTACTGSRPSCASRTPAGRPWRSASGRSRCSPCRADARRGRRRSNCDTGARHQRPTAPA